MGKILFLSWIGFPSWFAVKFKRKTFLFFLLVAALGLAAQTPPPTPAQNPIDGPENYFLSPGDTLELRFTYISELNEKVAVRPDGAISLTGIGDISTLDHTPTSLSKLISERYAKVYRRPEVTVIVRDFAERRAYVGGEVGTPGVVLLKGTPVNCLQALMASGGLRSSARLDSILLIRHLGQNQAEVKRLDLRQVLKGAAPDLRLKPFDVVFVPRSKIGKVNLFVEQYINGLMPRNIIFPYNLNTNFNIE